MIYKEINSNHRERIETIGVNFICLTPCQATVDSKLINYVTYEQSFDQSNATTKVISRL